MKMKYLFILLISILFYSCSDSTSLNNNKNTFGIYLLKDTTLITSDAKKMILESQQVQEKPIISINDIVSYNWTEHTMILTSEALEKFKNIEGKIKSISGLPFVLMVDQQIIYLGNIYPMYSSYIHVDLPHIDVAPFLEMKIGRAPLQGIKDRRGDKRIYTVLKENNKLEN